MNILKTLFHSGLVLQAFVFALPSTASVIPAATCGQADVQAAVDGAQDGDTVIIPPGTCQWTTPAACSSTGDCASVYIDKSITLKGSGNANTIIIDHTGALWNQVCVRIQSEHGKLYRITDFTIKNDSATNVGQAILVRGNTKTFRIDNMVFDFPGDRLARPIMIEGYGLAGLIDHNEFYASQGYQAIQISWDDPSGDSYPGSGTHAWELPLVFGSSQAVYIEDNNFDFGRDVQPGEQSLANIDCTAGGRYVLRHNTLHDIFVMGHGPGQSTGRGCSAIEIYENEITTDVSQGTNFNPIWLRAGSAVVFSNVTSGFTHKSIDLDNPRTCCGIVSCNGTYPINSRCNGTVPIDGNTPGMMGYPCLDQIGRGSGGPGEQTSDPLYEWNNSTIAGTDLDFLVINTETCSNPGNGDHIQSGRDFFSDTRRPGYVPYTYPHPLASGIALPNSPSGLSGQSPPPVQPESVR